MYPAHPPFYSVLWDSLRGSRYDPKHDSLMFTRLGYAPFIMSFRKQAQYQPIYAINIAEACYKIILALGRVPTNHYHVLSLEIAYPFVTSASDMQNYVPQKYIKGDSDEMRALAAEWQQKLPMYEELSRVIVTATAFNATINTEPRKIHERLADLELAERDLVIWKNMGHGLPDDQRQCYKPVRPIAIYALQAAGGNIDDAFVVLAMAERNLRTRAA